MRFYKPNLNSQVGLIPHQNLMWTQIQSQSELKVLFDAALKSRHNTVLLCCALRWLMFCCQIWLLSQLWKQLLRWISVATYYQSFTFLRGSIFEPPCLMDNLEDMSKVVGRFCSDYECCTSLEFAYCFWTCIVSIWERYNWIVKIFL